MMMQFRKALAAYVAGSLLSASLWGADPTGEPEVSGISFARQIRPLLSDKCFACHGPDEQTREADLRLDIRESAFDSGAIVAGSPDDSELIRRIGLADDNDEKMPPTSFHKDLSDGEIQLMREWIASGAAYEQHWAYRPLKRPPVPNRVAGEQAPIGNAIDSFIIEPLRQHGLTAAPPAEPITLIRRLYLDLIGIPPTPDQVQAFLDDSSDEAYENTVDSLLRDPQFGERMAVYWLDLVRYADTIGYHSDTYMEVSAYRDYVIQSFNDNKPFDEFTIEQLAGDLLPDPSEDQLVASGYNRLLQTTEEGGAQAKEYIAIYAADRVRNVSGVWMGQTVGCAQCHDHKYDPITMKDFYSLAAFFADLEENAVGKRKPNYTFVTPAQQAELDSLTDRVSKLQIDHRLESDEQFARALRDGQSTWEQLTLRAIESGKSPQPTPEDTTVVPAPVRSALSIPAEERSDEQRNAIKEHYRSVSPAIVEAKQELADAEKQLKSFQGKLQTMLIAKSVAEPRMTRILSRGNWLDESGDVVEPAVPAFLPHETIEGRRATRLDLANWLVSDVNPLTSRTFVNRLWKLFHGRGLSRNLDDLGGQGEAPSHPELLDWLAADFRDTRWDIKHLVRTLVTSSTYRQSSVANPMTRAKDPLNRLFGRQGRWRLEAEFVRDSALSISGLLVTETIGGQSVKPYQPAGYWQHLNFPKRQWKADKGPSLYRRGLYTFWCRTFLHPSMLAFDAPSREECTAERSRSNIPQQALVLLNDPIFVEASRSFADRIVESGGNTDDRIRWGIRAAMTRPAKQKEIKLLRSLYDDQLKRYTEAPEDARALLQFGDVEMQDTGGSVELAAWAQVARAILNAYETTSRF